MSIHLIILKRNSEFMGGLCYNESYIFSGGGKSLYNILKTALMVISVIIIFLVVLQPSKSNAASSLSGGGADDDYGQAKARGFEAFLIKATSVMGGLFFIVALALTYLSSQ